MKESLLKISEFIALENELTKGKFPLLTQKISFTTKYWLNILLADVKKESDPSNDIKNDLVKKWGVEDKGKVSLDMFIKTEDGEEIINPNMLKFQEEFSPVLIIEKELKHKDFNIEEFKDVSSEGYYPVFYKLINSGKTSE